MTRSSSGSGLLRRCAIGLWLCGIALVGLLRFYMKIAEDPGTEPALDAWLWLAGSVLVAIIGTIVLLRELRRKP